MVEEGAADLIDIVLKNMSIEVFKGKRYITERDVSRYLRHFRKQASLSTLRPRLSVAQLSGDRILLVLCS